MKTRIIHTRFWQDSFVCELSPKEKLLFIYLLTNDRVNLIGCYELPDKYILADLDLTKAELSQFKNKLQRAGKIIFKDGWIRIVNVDKYNSYNGEKLIRAKENELSNVPKELIEYKVSIDTSIHTSIDTLNNHKSKIINNKYNNIKNVDNSVMQELADKLSISVKDVENTLIKMTAWLEAKGKSYKNYKAGLTNWLLKSIEDGKIRKVSKHNDIPELVTIDEKTRLANIEKIKSLKDQYGLIHKNPQST
jgi:hypothetical protein